MQNDLLYTDRSSIYPGKYVSLYSECDFSKTIKNTSENKASSLPVNINESGNSYKIELAIPGVERENLFLKVCGNVLSVSVIHNNNSEPYRNKFQLHEFTFGGCISRKIVLPDNADPLFISAEYRSGILQLYIPKSAHPVKRIDTKIAVY
jgi:HSP20 family protein